MTHIEAMKLALEALQNAWLDASMGKGDVYRHNEAIKALQEALVADLSAPKQEQGSTTCDNPVAWADHGVVNWIADKQFKHAALLYEHPQQRTWVSLTEEEIYQVMQDRTWMHTEGLCRAIEAKLKEKNT
jgi:hypothetical protein